MSTSGHTPLYVQIADDLRTKIHEGVLRGGDRVPSENEICEQWPVSKITARKALATLRSEGLTESVRGKGTFVRRKAPRVRLAPQRWFRQTRTDGRPTYGQEAERAGEESVASRRSHETQATFEVAERLTIETGDPVSETHYLIVMDGEQVSMSVSWEPLALTGATAIACPTEGPHASLGVIGRFDKIGIRIDEVEEALDCRMPAPDEARALHMPTIGTPVVAIEQTWRAQGLPVCTANVVFPADRYEFRYRMEIK
ncbi:GntR family transcriptional regulator [Streptomyces sp. NPDC051577]|uniref:GntR family transcriptional regulator n=1 Tax=Streptomyces sp. NPDC051577 TaxID=3155166 RepID=UPI0034131BCE